MGTGLGSIPAMGATPVPQRHSEQSVLIAHDSVGSGNDQRPRVSESSAARYVLLSRSGSPSRSSTL
jgi:microcompartment protein CcmK/EutM